MNLAAEMVKRLQPNDAYLSDSVLIKIVEYFDSRADELGSEKVRSIGTSLLFSIARLVLSDAELRAYFFAQGEKMGVHVMPTHFYSPVPTTSEIPDKVFDTKNPQLPKSFDLGLEAQKSLLQKIGAFCPELQEIPDPSQTGDQAWKNGMFEGTDALAYYGILRHLKPKRIVEVGSGYSTVVAKHATAKNGVGSVTSIEPYPSSALKALTGVKLIEQPVQEVDLSVYRDLEAGDVLFIDSTHVAKPGSDVLHLFDHVLPVLKKGVWIHFHDIFIPFEYPKDWITKHHIFWNEQYLLRNFLSYNSDFKTRLSNAFWSETNTDLLRSCFQMPGGVRLTNGGSFWIERVAVTE